jgi:PAS domain S-box-containing protein
VNQPHVSILQTGNLLDLLHLFLDHTPHAVALFDCNMRYLAANSRWLEDYGLTSVAGNILGKCHYELLPDLPERWIAMYQRCLAGAVEACEELLARPDGSTEWMKWEARPWLSPDGKTLGLLVFSELISERKQLETLLQQALSALGEAGQHPELTQMKATLQAKVVESQQTIRTLRDRIHLLQLVLDSLPQAIFWKDRNSVYLGCNRRFAEDAGVGIPENIVGKTDHDLNWTKEEAERFREFDRRVMQNNQAELRVILPPSVVNERRGWVETSKIPLHDSEGNVIGVLGSSEDITERTREEDALRQSEAQLRQQAQQLEEALQELQKTQLRLVQTEKMSSLGQLVAGVAHEINNPVNFIHGNLVHANQYIRDLLDLLQLYQRKYPHPAPEIQHKAEEIDLEFLQEDLPKLLSSISLGADRIRAIVQSLRNFSRIDEAEIKDVDIHEGIDSTLMILQSRLKEKPKRPPIQVTREYGRLPKVKCYPGQLNQVFMNILSNAIDALEDGIQEEFETYQIDINSLSELNSKQLPIFVVQPCIKIHTESCKPGWVTIRISDNGPGMTETVQSRLFDPFFTTKPVGKGTGLGMSISYQIVTEKHKGFLRCISAPKQGAEFVIEIPVEL